jgi:AhpD family alkylhydroperoxidase
MFATSTDVTARRAAVRVPIEEPRDLFGRLIAWYSRRVYGDLLDNALVLLHNRRVLRAILSFENKVAKFDRLDPNLKALAEVASAGAIGCSWCLDFGYYMAHTKGLSVEKLKEVPRWRESDAFTASERLVIEYAEAMTATPPTVTDTMVARLNKVLGVPAVVELTMMVAIENERSRFNSALGLTSQGFSDRCGLPA